MQRIHAPAPSPSGVPCLTRARQQLVRPAYTKNILVIPASTKNVLAPLQDTQDVIKIKRIHQLLAPQPSNPSVVVPVHPALDRKQQANRRHVQRVSTAAMKGGNGSGLSASSSSSSGSGASSGGDVLVSEGNITLSTGAPSRGVTHHRALVLDSHYRPINVVPWPRAVMMDVSERVDVLDYYPAPACAYSGRGSHQLPAVVRVNTLLNLNALVVRVSCTRRNVLIRDKFSCQYCGAKRDLTLDHVVPACRGGKDTWTNLVTACSPCNQKKADKLLSNLPGWKLRSEPREPKPWELGMVLGIDFSGGQTPAIWEPYIETYRKRQRQIQRELQRAGIICA